MIKLTKMCSKLNISSLSTGEVLRAVQYRVGMRTQAQEFVEQVAYDFKKIILYYLLIF